MLRDSRVTMADIKVHTDTPSLIVDTPDLHAEARSTLTADFASQSLEYKKPYMEKSNSQPQYQNQQQELGQGNQKQKNGASESVDKNQNTVRAIKEEGEAKVATNRKMEEKASLARAPSIKDVDTSTKSTQDGKSTDISCCANCKSTTTTQWRRGNEGQVLCNACGIYERKNGTMRPLKLCDRRTFTRVKHKNANKANTNAMDSTTSGTVPNTQEVLRRGLSGNVNGGMSGRIMPAMGSYSGFGCVNCQSYLSAAEVSMRRQQCGRCMSLRLPIPPHQKHRLQHGMQQQVDPNQQQRAQYMDLQKQSNNRLQNQDAQHQHQEIHQSGHGHGQQHTGYQTPQSQPYLAAPQQVFHSMQEPLSRTQSDSRMYQHIPKIHHPFATSQSGSNKEAIPLGHHDTDNNSKTSPMDSNYLQRRLPYNNDNAQNEGGGRYRYRGNSQTSEPPQGFSSQPHTQVYRENVHANTNASEREYTQHQQSYRTVSDKVQVISQHSFQNHSFTQGQGPISSQQGSGNGNDAMHVDTSNNLHTNGGGNTTVNAENGGGHWHGQGGSDSRSNSTRQAPSSPSSRTSFEAHHSSGGGPARRTTSSSYNRSPYGAGNPHYMHTPARITYSSSNVNSGADSRGREISYANGSLPRTNRAEGLLAARNHKGLDRSVNEDDSRGWGESSTSDSNAIDGNDQRGVPPPKIWRTYMNSPPTLPENSNTPQLTSGQTMQEGPSTSPPSQSLYPHRMAQRSVSWQHNASRRMFEGEHGSGNSNIRSSPRSQSSGTEGSQGIPAPSGTSHQSLQQSTTTSSNTTKPAFHPWNTEETLESSSPNEGMSNTHSPHTYHAARTLSGEASGSEGWYNSFGRNQSLSPSVTDTTDRAYSSTQRSAHRSHSDNTRVQSAPDVRSSVHTNAYPSVPANTPYYSQSKYLEPPGMNRRGSRGVSGSDSGELSRNLSVVEHDVVHVPKDVAGAHALIDQHMSMSTDRLTQFRPTDGSAHLNANIDNHPNGGSIGENNSAIGGSTRRMHSYASPRMSGKHSLSPNRENTMHTNINTSYRGHSGSMSMDLDTNNSTINHQDEEGAGGDHTHNSLKQVRSLVGRRQCAKCNTTETAQWRSGINKEILCNSCGLRQSHFQHREEKNERRRKRYWANQEAKRLNSNNTSSEDIDGEKGGSQSNFNVDRQMSGVSSCISSENVVGSPSASYYGSSGQNSGLSIGPNRS